MHAWPGAGNPGRVLQHGAAFPSHSRNGAGEGTLPAPASSFLVSLGACSVLGWQWLSGCLPLSECVQETRVQHWGPWGLSTGLLPQAGGVGTSQVRL